jgi:hypothetical protein
LFSHEEQLEAELEKLKIKLNEVEEADKKKTTSGETDATPATTANGTTDILVKSTLEELVNGHSNTDEDLTAVNTPQGTSTPALNPPNAQLPTADFDDVAPLTPETLRAQTTHLEKLLQFLKNEFAPIRRKFNDLLANSEIQFNLLWLLYRLGNEVTFKDYESGLTMSGEVQPPIHN